MLKYARVKIEIKGNCSYKKRFNFYKPALSSKVASLDNKHPSGQVSNFDCDYTYVKQNCLYSFIYVENVPMFLQMCTHCKCDNCIITYYEN